MKVLLTEDVENVGYSGEVHEVADGYGRNYLIPQGLAIKATPGILKQAEGWRKRAETRRAQLRAENEALSARIEDTVLTFHALAGESGKLYGSITTAQITDALNDTLATDLDRRIVGSEPLRQLGEHKVVVRLSADFQPHVTVVIKPEGEVVPETTEPETAEPETAAAEEPTDVEETAIEEEAEAPAEA